MPRRWSGLGLLLVVPWLAGCVARPDIRLDTGQGLPIVFMPPATEPPTVEVRQEEFIEALAGLVLQTPMILSFPRLERRVVLASWSEAETPAPRLQPSQCVPRVSADDCLVLPANAPPSQTLARLRLALSFAMDTVWEGATVAIREVVDPLAFKVMISSAMCTYLVVLMMPEPVTKGLAAVLTAYLVAYLGLGPVWAMVEAGWQLLRECERATAAEEVRLAGYRFGRVLGNNGTRVLILLATAAIGGKAGFNAKGPKLPGFQRAALSSPLRTGVRLSEAGQVTTVVLGAKGLVIGLPPTAVAAAAMGPGGAGGPGTSSAASASIPDTANVRPPATRHYARQVDQRTLARDINSVLEPGVDVNADIAAIKGGHAQAGRTPGGEVSYQVNGRTYGAHPNGTLYPVHGDGIHVLNRGSFKALGVYNQFGNTPRAAQILDAMGLGAVERAMALSVWKSYQ